MLCPTAQQLGMTHLGQQPGYSKIMTYTDYMKYICTMLETLQGLSQDYPSLQPYPTETKFHPLSSSPTPIFQIIRESVDSLCRDGADVQYMQYLSKSRITSTQIC